MARDDIFIIMVAFMKDKSNLIKQTDLVSIMILFRVTNITDNGKTTFHMEKENKNFKMVPITKDSFFMELSLDLGIMYATQVFMKDNFLMEIFTEMEYLHMLTTDSTMDNGEMD